MKFYSYEYIKSRIVLTDWLQLSLFIGLAILIGVAIWFYYHRNKDSKYRELAIIGIICVFILTGSRWQVAKAKHAAFNQYSGALRLMDEVAQDIGVSSNSLYINTEAVADGGIIKINNRFYRTILDTEGNYLLEEMVIKEPKIELVEVNK